MIRFCTCCGSQFGDVNYPLVCANCGQSTYDNPVPVAVMIQPVIGSDAQRGLLTVLRNIQPASGEYALPGGFVENSDESIEGAARRELEEETGLVVPLSALKLHRSVISGGELICFVASSHLLTVDNLFRDFRASAESNAFRVAFLPASLAFPTHSEELRKFLNAGGSAKN